MTISKFLNQMGVKFLKERWVLLEQMFQECMSILGSGHFVMDRSLQKG